MKKITFRFIDSYCKDGKPRTQWCIMKSVEECINMYGLEKDCSWYEIVSVEDMN